MQVLISAAGRYDTFMLAVLALAMSALVIAACDSTIAPETGATIDPGDELVLGKDHKVAVCHVGHKLPLYDPACTENCGDAGKIDLIFVTPKAAEKHLNNPDHTFDGVSDYLPGDEGASGEGSEDTSDDGVYVDDGCVIPDDEGTIFAIAYTDVNPADGDGFKEGTDVLIAKLVDESGDGQPGAGDRVVMGSFPATFGGGRFALGVTEHVVGVDGCVVLDGAVRLACGVGGQFQWRAGTDGRQEWFLEKLIGESRLVDSVNGDRDGITIVSFSPSMPAVVSPVNSIVDDVLPFDDQFLDVILTLPPPTP